MIIALAEILMVAHTLTAVMTRTENLHVVKSK